ncbi:hypothetical protein J4P41_01905 [Gluconobacter sp. NFX36]|uniref:hypothetical protein n=1 Tax=Gluconobacter sp. NFX36 TaxID=2819535 RepID=UPI003CE9ECFA
MPVPASDLQTAVAIVQPSWGAGWYAPAALIAAAGLLISVATLLRAHAKDKRDQKIGPKLSDFDTRISAPLASALQQLEDAGVEFSNGFKQFKAASLPEKISERVKFAKDYQSNTLDPVRFRLAGALQRAMACRMPAAGKAWDKYEDDLDSLYHVTDAMSKEEEISIDKFEIMNREFTYKINSCSSEIKEAIQNTRENIQSEYFFTFFGIILKQK